MAADQMTLAGAVLSQNELALESMAMLTTNLQLETAAATVRVKIRHLSWQQVNITLKRRS